MWTDTYERLDTSKLTFVPHYKSTCGSRFMKMDCKSYKQAPVRECMSLSLCVGPPGCSWNMYAVSGSVEPLRIELGGRLLLMAATAAPQPSGSWKVLRYLWKFTAPFCTGHKKSEKKRNVICKAAELYWQGLASIQMMCFHEPYKRIIFLENGHKYLLYLYFNVYFIVIWNNNNDPERTLPMEVMDTLCWRGVRQWSEKKKSHCQKATVNR